MAVQTEAGGTRVDIEKAVSYMQGHVKKQPTYFCAKHLREALEAGGAYISDRPASAKDYGPVLERLGMKRVPAENYAPVKGDIVVVQPLASGDQNGHVAMYDGEHWLSDFVQADIWPSRAFRQANPPIMVYRQ